MAHHNEREKERDFLVCVMRLSRLMEIDPLFIHKVPSFSPCGTKSEGHVGGQPIIALTSKRPRAHNLQIK